jgi:lysophospholipase L1-like esterase
MSSILHLSPTWLALGDSYTIGEGVPLHERWPTQLANRQNLAPPQYVAKTGWTTLDLLEAIAQTNFKHQYDWISVLIGVNDQYDGLSIDTFRRALIKITDFATRRVAQPHRVVVISIPDYSVVPAVKEKNPSHIASQVGRFNSAARQIATAASATYCDITELSRRAADDSSLLVADQLHPSGKMYKLWAEKIARVVFNTVS